MVLRIVFKVNLIVFLLQQNRMTISFQKTVVGKVFGKGIMAWSFVCRMSMGGALGGKP